MAIPKEILSVERPKNTVIQAYGKNKDKYLVKARTGCRYVNGKRYPVNGPTIGHIVDGKFVPVEEEVSSPDTTAVKTEYEDKTWAAYELCSQEFGDLMDDLLTVYNPDDAKKIACISILRACHPGIRNDELKSEYEGCFLSETFPGVGLGKKTVQEFYKALGAHYNGIIRFMGNRAAKVGVGHHIILDAITVSDNTPIRSLSDFQIKEKDEKEEGRTLVFAFDLENMEPVCSKCHIGDDYVPDRSLYSDLMKDCGIPDGIIVLEKGFPSNEYESPSKDGVHYLRPVEQTPELVKTYNLHSYQGLLPRTELVEYKKVKVGGVDKWLYSFRDTVKAGKEEYIWLTETQRNAYDHKKLEAVREYFGTTVLECDMDISAEAAYDAYSQKWIMGLMMASQKSVNEADENKSQYEVSVYGYELCGFISTVLTSRLVRRFGEADLLKDYTFGRVMELLLSVQMVRENGKDGWVLPKQTKESEDLLRRLNLLKGEGQNEKSSEEPAKRKRGRPSKKKD